MTTLTETLHAGGFMVSESPGFRSREAVTVAISQTLVAGQIVGFVGKALDASASAVVGTGNGVITLGTPKFNDGVKPGNYRVVFVEPVTNLGTFQVEDPDGNVVGTGVVGTLFNGPVRFTVADGATDFVAGDYFTITVFPDVPQAKALTLAATDGSQIAAGVMWEAITTGGSATAKQTAVVRDAEVRASDLTYPGSITTNQKALVHAQLAAIGIIVR